ncbi:glycosyltransferase family 2 protein [Flavobacterium dankookense]|uniref:GT2 family glycosyltransferase n=1 Tax=Flavobacterium dankookense TaxID=706186 RepID=A0A4R6QER5_9FLAO|nr:glycosyltransferase family 2 protein [Flavobacterium dankookense]TDP60737.1 GT2 family glycosyltransferase [Flavobacterium dankookense]
MQLSVIILNYNVRYFLELCVLSVQKAIQNIDAEIIVVDNNSSDDSCAMMAARFPNVKLIENKTNFGFPKGNNIGVDQAKGEYICILNPDTVVAEDTFEKILNTKNWQLNTGLIGCKLIDGTGNFLPESKRGVPTPWVAFTKIFGLYKISNVFGKYYAQHLSENQSGKVDILVGAFMVMKRSLYLEVGGFDENCFMYSDDIDLSYMVKKSGRENYYFAEASVIHYKGESTVRDEKYMKRFQEAMNFFYNKHFKKSLFFSGFMKIGAFVFSKIKKAQQKNRSITIDNYIFFSKNEVQLALEKPVSYQTNLLDFSPNNKLQTEIIFDIQSFSFKEIIDFMQKHKAATITYKMYLPQSKVIIGSNHANDIGEIINLSKIA